MDVIMDVMEHLVLKPGEKKSPVWAYFGFVAGGDGKLAKKKKPHYLSLTINIIHVKYCSCYIDVNVSFTTRIFSCIEIIWLRIIGYQKSNIVQHYTLFSPLSTENNFPPFPTFVHVLEV